MAGDPVPARSLRWPAWICASYESAAGQLLCAPGELDGLGAVVLCHDTSADPVFVYANAAAQTLWERRGDEFIGWPSRLTAPAQARAERAQALSQPGLVRGYSGVRITRGGRLFRIHDATVWTVHDQTGLVVGQAATFDRVTWDVCATTVGPW